MVNIQDDSLSGKIIRWISKNLCCCCREEGEVTKGSHSFRRAPEPTDVYWDNLSVSYLGRFCRVLMTYFFTILLIGVCFGCIYGITILKRDINEDAKNDELEVPENVLRGLNILASFIIVIIN